MLSIKSSRLTLDMINDHNKLDVCRLLTDNSIMQFDFDGPLDQLEAENLLKEWELFHDKNGFGRLTVSLSDGKVIGYCGVVKMKVGSKDEYELDFRLLPEHCGKGYATEATTAYCKILRDEHGVKSLVAAVKPFNSKTIHVIQKIGMIFESEIKISGRKSHLYRFDLSLVR